MRDGSAGVAAGGLAADQANLLAATLADGSNVYTWVTRHNSSQGSKVFS